MHKPDIQYHGPQNHVPKTMCQYLNHLVFPETRLILTRCLDKSPSHSISCCKYRIGSLSGSWRFNHSIIKTQVHSHDWWIVKQREVLSIFNTHITSLVTCRRAPRTLRCGSCGWITVSAGSGSWLGFRGRWRMGESTGGEPVTSPVSLNRGKGKEIRIE